MPTQPPPLRLIASTVPPAKIKRAPAPASAETVAKLLKRARNLANRMSLDLAADLDALTAKAADLAKCEAAAVGVREVARQLADRSATEAAMIRRLAK